MRRKSVADEASKLGRVWLVGAGPGDPDLITLRGAKILAQADVVLYDELASDELLDLTPDGAKLVNVGKRGHDEPTRGQDDINRLLIEHARAGRTVVRLKGGDPLVFGRGGEEMSACAAAGIPFEIVPGVTSAVAALAYAGIPVTDRRYSASFAVVTGHKDPSKVAEQTRWQQLGTAVDTLVILMGMRNLSHLVDELIAGGKPPDTPAAAVMHGTLPEQRTCVSTLAALPEAVRLAEMGAPSVVVVGDVVRLRDGLSWWERKPLFGRQVLVTRASGQADLLAAALRSVGAAPVLVPMIEFAPMLDSPAKEKIDTALGQLDRYRSVVFTSSNAVRFFARAVVAHSVARGAGTVASRGAAFSVSARIFCVGEQTATAAYAAGMPVHLVASGRRDAETLLGQLLQVGPAAGERVLIPGSQIARSNIADGLRAAGAEVDTVAFYQNRKPEVDVVALRGRLLRGELFALTFSSPSTVDHFLSCLDEESLASARQCMIAAIGRTTAARLADAGFDAVIVPNQPEVVEMVDGLVGAAASGIAAEGGGVGQ